MRPAFVARGRRAGSRDGAHAATDETIVDGIENAPDAFLGLLRGENIGKMVVRL